MEALKFLQDLTLVLSTAAAVLLVFRKFKQPPVLGYLAAGLLIGHHGPFEVELVADHLSLEAMAEIGVVFLLFALGVEFNLKRLAAVGARALVCAGIEAAFMFAVGYGAGLLLGLGPLGSLLLGGIISLASTAIVARTLLEYPKKSAGFAELASGVLIAEDILAVILIAFFSSTALLGGPDISAVFSHLARLGMLATIILVGGLLLLPRIWSLVERSGMNEVRTLVIIGTCFGVSFITERLGFSSALGAFLAGAMMSETAAATKLRETVEPFKDVFGAVFFVAVGTMIDPSWIFEHWKLALALIALVAVTRTASNFLGFCVVGEDKTAALQASLVRMPIGEFSFILAQMGDRQGLTEVPLYPLAVILCLGTTFVSASLAAPALEKPEKIDGAFPEWLAKLLGEYRAGLKRLTVPKRMKMVYDLIRPSLIQIFLNILGISGLFMLVNIFQKRYAFDVKLPGVVWMATTFFSLPFILALWRKTQAVTLILLEEITTRGSDPRPPMETHPRMTKMLLGLATVGVAWWYISISLKLLPEWPYTLWPLAVMLLAGTFLWRGMNRLYAQIQVNLRETLAKAHAEPEASSTVISHLVEAQSVRIVTHTLVKDCPAVGKSIRDLDIRARSKASILQINRGKDHIAAPGAGVHLHEGDELVIIGERAEIEEAKRILEGKAEEA